MTGEFVDVRKAVDPAEETPIPVPVEATGGVEGVTLPPHGPERTHEERLMLLRIRAYRFLDLDRADCVCHEFWEHPDWGVVSTVGAVAA